MLFYISVIFFTLLYLIILELSKNIIIGWLISGFAAVLMITLRIALKRKNILNSKANIVMWLCFLLVLIANYKLTEPPYLRIPAVENKNPKITSEVAVEQGLLTGVYNEDESVKVYAGIPYANAPVGELRFKEPMAPDKWDGVLACDHFGPMAMQQTSSPFMDSLSHILGWYDYKFKFGDEYREAVSEDCLYLNVFAPEQDNDELLPVIFYVHGGSLTTGQSSYSEYRGESLAKKGVIFVNFAYRLGVFGYYAADDLKNESPNNTTGNYGLLDQIAALKWVYNNIEAFGGDPSRITIAGESAGSSSVNALCASPLTEGLFNYAIAESSSVLAKKPFHTFRDYQDAVLQGDLLREEFSVASSDELRNIPAEELVKTSTKNSSMTIDGYALTEMPYLTYEKGENHEKALLNGFNLKEADAFLMDTNATKDNYVELLSEDLEGYAQEMADVLPYDAVQRDEYFIVDKKGEAKGSLNAAYSAMWFSYSHYVWTNYMVQQNRPVYEYYFTKTNSRLSNNHAGELPYAYGNLHYNDANYNESDYKLSEIMQNYWVNFTKTGNPNGESLPDWPAVTADQPLLINFDNEITLMEDPNLPLYKVIDRFMEDED